MRLPPFAFLLCLSLTPACGSAGPIAAQRETDAGHAPDASPFEAANADAGAEGDDAGPGANAVAPNVPGYEGSPLCNASVWMGCYPDDPWTANAQECNLAPDGGTYNAAAGYDDVLLGCHVERASNALGIAPVCAPPGAGVDGAACGASSDCAPGFECISDGTCRHYCCSGECSSASEFCDIQTAMPSMLKVPVCIPMRHCTLLAPTDTTATNPSPTTATTGTCAADETCAVAGDNGATSCVAIGPQQAGQQCNTDHCARELTCIGGAGQRTCYALCRTGVRGNTCPVGQTCTAGLPLFPTPGVGICK